MRKVTILPLILFAVGTLSCGGGTTPDEPEVPAWRPAKSPTVRNIYALWPLAEDNVWAVGQGGNVLRFNGDEWQLVITTLTKDLYDIQFVAPGRAWVCGADGFAADGDGVAWNEHPQTLSSAVLYGLHALSTNDCWFCGAGGTILHYKAGVWHDESPSGVSEDLYAIRATGDGGGWCVGGAGRILKRCNNNWVPVTSPANADYHCAFFINDNEGWFGGSNGYVIHYKNGGLSKTCLLYTSPSPRDS